MEKRGSLEERRGFWEQHLREWKSSGLSQAEFCRQNKLSLKSFVYWKKRHKSMSGPVCLVEVDVRRQPLVSFPSSSTPLRLLVGGQYRIEIEKNFDAEALDQLIQFLNKR
jgi:hypothetical protein